MDNDITFMVVEDNDGFVVLFVNAEGFNIWSEFHASMSEVKAVYAEAIAGGRFIDATI
jgi:hypothetical protein